MTENLTEKIIMKIIIKIACFLSIITIPAIQIQSQESLWKIYDQRNSGENEVALLSNTSEASINNLEHSEKVFPELSLYCEEGSPNISIKINWKRYISSFNKTEIGIKIDGKNYTWLSFNLDKTGQISFQDPSTHSNELIKKFKKIKKLAVEIEPYSEPPINVYFNLSGFASHLENLKSICSQ